MSRKNQSKHKKKPAGGRRIFWVVGLAIMAAGLAGWWLYQGRSSPGPSTEERAASVDFSPLIGKWLRADGGYVIDIRNIRSDGRMDASYLNPRPIHVARAEASLKGGMPQVFIELRDQGYPGSTYTLLYNREDNVLAGTYYQAAMGRNFNVIFAREE